MAHATKAKGPHWLDDYGGQRYQWRKTKVKGETAFYRPLGLTESAFDSDGRYYEGRADLNSVLELEVKSTLSKDQLHQQILLAWTCLRCQHSLLRAASTRRSEVPGAVQGDDEEYCFVVNISRSSTKAIEDAREHVVFLDNFYDTVDTNDFWYHTQNTARVIDPAKALSRLFVFPPSPTTASDTFRLRLLLIGSHQIWDGLTASNWFRAFLHHLNQSPQTLLDQISLASLNETTPHLPLPQEALYPRIPGSRARQRWFWLLTRIHQHIRTPLPAGFPNPLLRPSGPRPPTPLPATYAAAGLSYTRLPPITSGPAFATLPPPALQILTTLCRDLNASLGAACFALTALATMTVHESQFPDIPLHERKPFIAGFPLNPRAFLDSKPPPESLMLAFSAGIVLPFLPSSLSKRKRLRLLIKIADRQLGAYRKPRRKVIAPTPSTPTPLNPTPPSPARALLASTYLTSLTRAHTANPNLPPLPNPPYPPNPNPTPQTHGISSLGSLDAILHHNLYPLTAPAPAYPAFIADFRAQKSNVRARSGEFLVGISGGGEGVGVGVSVDFSAMDEGRVREWVGVLEQGLEDDADGGGGNREDEAVDRARL
ncbi:hypothetical protein B0A50_01848 [Salinomyces thailandicus]|uniref:Alcohol acetyltransferase n=1 Tax=Salinomyces thailandicus TaxID=706561 RepID=A0A4U0U8Y3_9PEZI|nr:hypothetical protein B0A50_01848 [Salinomyces thailandica]